MTYQVSQIDLNVQDLREHIPGSGATKLGVFVGAAKYAAVGSVRAGAIFVCLSLWRNIVFL